MKRTLFGRKPTDHTPDPTPEPTPDVRATGIWPGLTTSTASRLAVRTPQEAAKLTRSRAYDLGTRATLVHLTFDGPVELVELLDTPEGQTFSARLWDGGGWPIEVQVALGNVPPKSGVVLKDVSGRHAYFTVIAENPKGRAEHTLDVTFDEARPADDWQ